MKNTIVLLLLIFSCHQSFGQLETGVDRKISAIFEQKFNTEDFTGIFEMFSTEMQTVLPKEKAINFLTSFKAQLSKIKEREFTSYVRGSFASYKTTFEKGIFIINISTDGDSKINGLLLEPYKSDIVSISARNTSTLILPFNDEWTVVWGGDTAALNYHVKSIAQKNAFDLVITDENGRSYKSDGTTNEDYYAFGKELIAPTNGTVVVATDGIEDNIPGQMNTVDSLGNAVVLKTESGEYIYFAHLKRNSIKVKQGQKVVAGDVLGLCGNSGNSSEPHLHFHIQDALNESTATGIKSYFKEIMVDNIIKKDYSPIQGEKIKNVP
ncbi:peptidoglycan DD-metalloendopeptidase family protein [Nonlabens antarcticus]|uniref:peptidoglycan DD-metalloendopeptidase family protein n=1 Tax=Nonlabens antarcticus TaxID=392714 RepID=UPI001891B50F|nr:peptidoglycan DD-metalloendopeptidase family protein [Nonlabens antarcticus]